MVDDKFIKLLYLRLSFSERINLNIYLY